MTIQFHQHMCIIQALAKMTILVKLNEEVKLITELDIVVGSGNMSFKSVQRNLFSGYELPLKDYKKITAYVKETGRIKHYRTQVNFAFWCATSGCGISMPIIGLRRPQDTLKLPKMITDFFGFHVYYQTRRILSEMGSALPQDTGFNWENNTYNDGVRGRIFREFGIKSNSKFRLWDGCGRATSVFNKTDRMERYSNY